MTDGLTPPLNVPPGVPLGIGIQPGTTGPVIAPYVIVFGALGGVYVYSGSPGPGNPPVAWVATGTKDPYGNPLPSTTGVAGTGTFSAGNTYILPNGVIVGYSGTPAANNLAWSSNPLNANYTDANSNVILPGLTAYSGSVANGYSAVQLQALTANSSPLIAFYQSSTMSSWGSGVGIAGNPGSPAANLVLSGQAGGLWMLQSGALYIANPTSVGTVESWHSMPGFATNYSHGSPVPSYKLNNDNTVSFAGEVNVAANAAGATFVTLPSSDYFPVSTKKYTVPISAGTPSATANVQVTVNTSGGVILSAPPTGAAYSFALDQIRYPLDF